MAERVDDGFAADRCSLFTNMGVNVKARFSSSSAFKPCDPNNAPTHQPAPGQGNVHEDEGGCRGRRRDRAIPGGLWGHRPQIALFMAVLFSCSALLLSIWCLVYVRQQSQLTTCQLQALRQHVPRLDSLCADTSQWPASQPHAVTGTSHPQLRGFPWQQDANRFASAMTGANDQHNWNQNLEEEQKAKSAFSEDDTPGENAHLDSSSYLHFLRRSRQKRSSNGKQTPRTSKARSGLTKRTRREGNKKSRTCKMLQKCMKKSENGGRVSKKCRRMLGCIPPPSGPKAVHFTSKYLNGKRQRDFNKDTHSEELHMAGEDKPLHFNKEAFWMAKVFKDRSQQPLIPLNDGGFNVTQSGIYFIYSSVMFHDVKPRHSQAVVVNGQQLFKCMDNVDYLNNSMTSEEQKKYKTCTVTGVTQLRVGDRLEVQNLYAQTEIDLAEYASYVGAILLTPF